MKTIFTPMLVVAGLVALDQGSKVWVRLRVPYHQSSNLIPNLIDLTHVENRGVSFSFLGNLGDPVRLPLLLTVSLAALGVLIFYWWRHRGRLNFFSRLAFQLIVGGAVGNLIDRAARGAVTDFFHFRFYDTSFFVNNLADIFISAGVIAYLVGMLPALNRRQARTSAN